MISSCHKHINLKKEKEQNLSALGQKAPERFVIADEKGEKSSQQCKYAPGLKAGKGRCGKSHKKRRITAFFSF